MHLLVPFAFVPSEGVHRALSGLALPHLRRLLARLRHVTPDHGDELSLSPPHERAWARARGWPLTDGLLPLAAQAARDAGLSVPIGSGWAFVHPTHWHWGTEQASLTDPAALALDDTNARPLFNALVPLFADAGWRLHWLRPDVWLAQHALLATLPTASLDRVIGRNVDPWLDAAPEVRPVLRQVRRLQAEAQMVLHTLGQPLEHPVNSIWFSGTGPAPAPTPIPPGWQVDIRLRAPALADDGAAWAAAWQALDAGPIQSLLTQPANAPVALTLCGERHALCFTRASTSPWWHRLGWLPAAPQPSTVLTTL